MTWAPDYATKLELAAYARIADAADDTQLDLALSAASRAVDSFTRRQFGQTAGTEARTYTAVWDAYRCRWVIPVDDFMDATGLTVTVPTGTVDLFAKQPANAVTKGMPWTRLVVDKAAAYSPTGAEDEVTVTAKWGWIQPWPATIKQATLLQASRVFARRESPYGVAGSPQMGSELRLLEKMDADVAVMLTPYVRKRLKVG